MTKQLRQKLQSTLNAQLALSMVIQPKNFDHSIICELGDLIDNQQSQNINISNQRSYQIFSNDQQFSTFLPKHPHKLKTQSSIYQPSLDNQIQNLITTKIRNKFPSNKNTQKLHYLQSKYKIKQKSQHMDKKNIYKQLPYMELSKDNNQYFKLKFQINKSGVVKYKQFIYHLLDTCQLCGSIKSDVYGANLICSNKHCRLLSTFQNSLTFPFIGLLLQQQIPSSSHDDLQQLINKIKLQIHKTQQWLKSLQDLSTQIYQIMQNRKHYQKSNKVTIKQFLSHLPTPKSKKSKQPTQIQKTRQYLLKIPIQQVYHQFQQWQHINIQKLQQNKPIYDLIQKYKPISLKIFNNQLAQQFANITDNFKACPLYIKASQYLGYHFIGNLNYIILKIDSSIQVKRQNFLFIQKLQKLKLIFQCRKTSRQLRQLFNILPHPRILIINFDYKLHSHLSSQSFPFLSKSSQLSDQQLQLIINNARPQLLDDLMETSKIITYKKKIKIILNINSHIEQNQWPSNVKSKQWGTKIIKNFISNVGSQINHLQLVLPIYINSQQIYQYILNNNFPILLTLTIKTLNQNELLLNTYNKLLTTLICKRNKIINLLSSQKKQKNHFLNINYKLASSIYQVLF